MKIVKIIVKIEDELSYGRHKWFTVRLPNNIVITLKAEDCLIEEVAEEDSKK